MKHALRLGLLVMIWAACSDVSGPGSGAVSLAIVPEFDRFGVFASNADLLRIRIRTQDSATADAGQLRTVVDDTVSIDPETGEAAASFTVVVLRNPQTFFVMLEAIRSSDGAVLFSGEEAVEVTSGSSGGGTQDVTIPVVYQGPRSARVDVSPLDTAVSVGATWTYTAEVFDSAGGMIDVPVTFRLATAADSVALTVGKFTGAAQVVSDLLDEVKVVAMSADSVTDTATVFIGAIPASLLVDPGFGTVAVGQTLQLQGTIFDQQGNSLGSAGVTWTSRNPGIASVDGSGVVTGAAQGEARIVAQGGGFADSALVRVAAAGQVPVSATSLDRAFREASVGDTIVVDITADMQFSGELLGSYNATLTFDPSRLDFLGVSAGNFAAATVNSNNVGIGELRFSSADAQGVGGAVVVISISFEALAQGSGGVALTLSEMSAAQTFNDLISNVVVTSGIVTVR